jgi:glucose-6-phosphate 1-dehydrogenase
MSGAKEHGLELDVAKNDAQPYMNSNLTIVVIGASGDLAKKKTFPTIFELYCHGFIPKHVIVAGYARSKLSLEDFHTLLRKALAGKESEEKIEEFITKCVYFSGQYDSNEAFGEMDASLKAMESTHRREGASGPVVANRLWYFAIPPNVFINTASSINVAARARAGWNRLIVEKPFGNDLKSALKMSTELTAMWDEPSLYRIDHYLGKEMVQNLQIFRFGNTFLEPLMNSKYVKCVRVIFKEDFGTQGRGGYFDNYGIIRDIMQNHLMQVLTLVAMEPPVCLVGGTASDDVRNAKVNVLKAIQPLTLDDVVVGQYIKNDKGDEGYLEDPTVPAGSICPTFAQAHIRVHTPRWEGTPFIMKAGKALEERRAEIRVQFKDAPAASFMFDGATVPRNELVMRLQPDEAVYMKVNVKEPGLFNSMVQTELDLSYNQRYKGVYRPDAYARLILDCLKGSQASFVRTDELEQSWNIFDPLLKELEEKRIQPKPYVYGSRGPKEADEQSANVGGFIHNKAYNWTSGK